MTRSIVRMVSFVAAGLALSSVAFGQHTSGTGWEAGVDIVFQGSKTLHFEGGTNAALDSDTGLSFTFGYRYSPHLEAQFALDWQNVTYDANLVTGPGSSVSARGDYQAFTPRANIQFNFVDQALTPYVMAGIGYSFIDTNIRRPSGQRLLVGSVVRLYLRDSATHPFRQWLCLPGGSRRALGYNGIMVPAGCV